VEERGEEKEKSRATTSNKGGVGMEGKREKQQPRRSSLHTWPAGFLAGAAAGFLTVAGFFLATCTRLLVLLVVLVGGWGLEVVDACCCVLPIVEEEELG